MAIDYAHTRIGEASRGQAEPVGQVPSTQLMPGMQVNVLAHWCSTESPVYGTMQEAVSSRSREPSGTGNCE